MAVPHIDIKSVIAFTMFLKAFGGLLFIINSSFGAVVLRSATDLILWDLQNNPYTWLQVAHILQNTQKLNTKFFALQMLAIVHVLSQAPGRRSEEALGSSSLELVIL